MSSYRPRRTRLYGATYDIGESYYKKQLDNLDSKGLNSRLSDSHLRNDSILRDEKLTPKVSFYNDADDDVDFLKHNASRPLPRSNYLDDLEFDEPSAFLKAHSAKKDILSKYADADSQADDAFTLKRYRMKSDISSMENGDSSAGRSALSSRARFADLENGDAAKDSLLSRISATKARFADLDLGDSVRESSTTRTFASRTRFVDTESSESSKLASSRALASKARLADLDAEMLNITEKQNEREKRKIGLRKLLAENDSDDFKF